MQAAVNRLAGYATITARESSAMSPRLGKYSTRTSVIDGNGEGGGIQQQGLALDAVGQPQCLNQQARAHAGAQPQIEQVGRRRETAKADERLHIPDDLADRVTRQTDRDPAQPLTLSACAERRPSQAKPAAVTVPAVQCRLSKKRIQCTSCAKRIPATPARSPAMPAISTRRMSDKGLARLI